LAKEEAEVRKVCNLLQSDPAFSAEILTLANSSLYSHVRRIDTVQRAVTAIGMERTRALAATVALQAVVGGVRSAEAVQDCWRHCRASAIIAEQIAPFYRLQADSSYTSAIMHDVGRLGMLAAHSEYPKLLESAAGTTAELLDMEREAFSLDHCEAGLWLCRLWGLPNEFWATASQHHAPVAGTPGDRTDLVALCCMFADTLGFPAATKVHCEPVENLIECIPDAVRPRSLFDVQSLKEVLDRELVVQVT
jgi:HD-like signal output (HDOD) protein